MEAALHPYIQGAIVEYIAPFPRDYCQKHGVLPTHPIMIVSSNMASPSSTIQAMVLTSRVNSYYGYRIYMNSDNNRYQKFSVVCTTKIFTIEKANLRKIIGFVSPSFVRKCLLSYAYELGLTDEVPEYYKNSHLAMEYIESGEANVPKNPEAYQIPALPLGTFSKLNIASDNRIKGDSMAVVKTVMPRIIVNPNEFDSYYYDDELEPSDAPKNDAEDPSDSVLGIDEEDDEAKEWTVSEEGESQNHTVEKGNAVDSKASIRTSSVLSIELKDAIEARDLQDIEEPKTSDAVKILMNDLSDEDRYLMWICRKSQTQLMREGKAASLYIAKKLMGYSNHMIKKLKTELINNLIEKKMNLRFMSDRYKLAYRCLTFAEIKSIHMGVTTYLSYAKSYQINPEDTYLGELSSNGLIYS